MVVALLRNWLKEPGIQHMDVDSVDATLLHRRVLLKKPMLRAMFQGFYRDCRTLDERLLRGEGKRLEIGSGSSAIKDFYPDIVTSDIKPLPFVDIVASGDSLPFPSDSLRAIYGINVFHHLPDSRAFFREAIRVLAPGGGVIFIEPYYGAAARLLFPRLHESEGYDLNATDWGNPEQTGPCSRVNQALSYIVFKRDHEQFRNEFPQLELVLDRPHTHLMYLLSGGVNFRQMVPSALTGLVQGLEKLSAPANRWLALQHTIVLRKK